MTRTVDYRCAECGSDLVFAQLWTEWNVERQEWGEGFGNTETGMCCNCQRMRPIKEVAVEKESA